MCQFHWLNSTKICLKQSWLYWVKSLWKAWQKGNSMKYTTYKECGFALHCKSPWWEVRNDVFKIILERYNSFAVSKFLTFKTFRIFLFGLNMKFTYHSDIVFSTIINVFISWWSVKIEIHLFLQCDISVFCLSPVNFHSQIVTFFKDMFKIHFKPFWVILGEKWGVGTPIILCPMSCSSTLTWPFIVVPSLEQNTFF